MHALRDTRKGSLQLASGQTIPVLGMGTWRMGENARNRQTEINALRHGLDLGLSLIDTAEMYGEGGAEAVIAEAIANRRSEVFLVSKVYPYNASKRGAIAACERSLKRLQTDYLDLYLLHWRGSIPLSETLEAFQTLQQAGKIRGYGVSNFDTEDMQEASHIKGGNEIATNQVLYNVAVWAVSHHLSTQAETKLRQTRYFTTWRDGELSWTCYPGVGNKGFPLWRTPPLSKDDYWTTKR